MQRMRLVPEARSDRLLHVTPVGRTADVDVLLARLPRDDPDRAALQARAAAYSRDCGCAMGAAFLVGSTLLATVYFTLVGGLSVQTAGAGLLFVLLAALAGKASGLGLAAIKLALLRRSIWQRLRTEERFEHVHVH
jgi:hypothetical protein